MPEALLLDTDILIDIGRAIPEALAFLEQTDRAAMPSISVVTEMELEIEEMQHQFGDEAVIA